MRLKAGVFSFLPEDIEVFSLMREIIGAADCSPVWCDSYQQTVVCGTEHTFCRVTVRGRPNGEAGEVRDTFRPFAIPEDGFAEMEATVAGVEVAGDLLEVRLSSETGLSVRQPVKPFVVPAVVQWLRTLVGPTLRECPALDQVPHSAQFRLLTAATRAFLSAEMLASITGLVVRHYEGVNTNLHVFCVGTESSSVLWDIGIRNRPASRSWDPWVRGNELRSWYEKRHGLELEEWYKGVMREEQDAQ